jgi:hypothetical protein
VNGIAEGVYATPIKFQDIQNFCNVIFFGQGHASLQSSGTWVVNTLNSLFKDKNVFVQNYGDTSTGESLSSLLTRTTTVVEAMVPSARDICIVYFDWSVESYSNAINTIASIITELQTNNIEVWVCTYPPKSDSSAILLVNEYIRTNNSVDKVIDLWQYFVNPSTGNTPLSTLVDSSDVLTQAGSTALYNVLKKTILESLDLTISLNRVNVSKRLLVTTDIDVTNTSYAQSGICTDSGLSLYGNTKNNILFAPVGFATPSLSTRSLGTKEIFNPALGSSTYDTAIGTSSTSLWFSVPSTSYTYDFYTGTSSPTTSIGHTGITVTGTLTTTGSFSNASKLYFTDTSLAAPTITSTSLGSRIVLMDAVSSSTSNYEIGVNTSELWLASVGKTSIYQNNLLISSFTYLNSTNGYQTMVKDRLMVEGVVSGGALYLGYQGQTLDYTGANAWNINCDTSNNLLVQNTNTSITYMKCEAGDETSGGGIYFTTGKAGINLPKDMGTVTGSNAVLINQSSGIITISSRTWSSSASTNLYLFTFNNNRIKSTSVVLFTLHSSSLLNGLFVVNGYNQQTGVIVVEINYYGTASMTVPVFVAFAIL